MKRTLEDKVVMVTGGGSGIGRSTAMAFVEEVSQVVVWLCSDSASFITDHSLPIDGGLVAQ